MTQGVSTGDPTDFQLNLKDEEYGTGAEDLDPSKKLLCALDKKDALKVWELVKNKGGLINSLKNFYPDIADWERNSHKSIRCEFTCGCTKGQLLPENPEAVWKKDEERRRWIKILSNPLFIGVEWFLRTEANKGETQADKGETQADKGETQADKGENEDVIICALEDAHLLEEVTSLEQNRERDEQNKERDNYKSLVEKYETFATNVINESSWGEFYKIMNVEGDNSVLDERSEGVTKLKGCLSLLKIAAKMRRKTFVTAPICQFIVDQITFEGWRDWKRKSCQEKVFRWFVHFLGALILAPIYIPLRLLGKVCPSKSNGECFFRSSCRGKCFCCLYEFPFSKFVNHAMSYIILLCLLFSSTLGNEIQYYSETGLHRLDYAVLIFVIGLSLRDFIGACNQGASFYFSKWWNVMHVVTTSTFLVSYSVWLIAWEIDGEWDPKKEIFTVADVLYATATVMAFFHFTYVFQTSSTLGPLQLSLFKMVKDVLRFLFIFFILFLAFAAGVVKVYAYYVSSQIKLSREPGNSTYEKDHPYAKHNSTAYALIWMLFGNVDEEKIQVDDPAFSLISVFGRMFLITYVVCVSIVALNMLIAMMNNSYERIMDEDLEWKFTCTEIWLDYMTEGNSIPVPFNLVYYSLFVLLYIPFCWLRKCREKENLSRCCEARRVFLGCSCVRKSRKAGNLKKRVKAMKKPVARYLKKNFFNNDKCPEELNEFLSNDKK